MKSGIYKITCLPTGKFYIGSSVDIEIRFSDHKSRLRANRHANPYLQNSWNKYGEDNFVFEVVQYIEEACLLDVEQDWLDKTNCYNNKVGFNSSHSAYGGGKSKQFLVIAPNGDEFFVDNLYKFCRKNGLNASGMAHVARGLVNQYKSYQVRYANQTLSEWKKTVLRPDKKGSGWKHSYKVTSPHGETEIIKSLTDYCQKNNLSQGNMTEVAKGRRKQHKGYLCSYYSENSTR